MRSFFVGSVLVAGLIGASFAQAAEYDCAMRAVETIPLNLVLWVAPKSQVPTYSEIAAHGVPKEFVRYEQTLNRPFAGLKKTVFGRICDGSQDPEGDEAYYVCPTVGPDEIAGITGEAQEVEGGYISYGMKMPDAECANGCNITFTPRNGQFDQMKNISLPSLDQSRPGHYEFNMFFMGSLNGGGPERKISLFGKLKRGLYNGSETPEVDMNLSFVASATDSFGGFIELSPRTLPVSFPDGTTAQLGQHALIENHCDKVGSL